MVSNGEDATPYNQTTANQFTEASSGGKMVSKVSKGGLALAEQIVLAHSDHPSIKAVMVGGSVSRGYADRYSDLEVGVFWSDAPTEART